MQHFFADQEALVSFLTGLQGVVCPFCGGCGTLVRHGYLRGWVSPKSHGVRGWRVFCDPMSPRGKGCGRTQSLRLAASLQRRCFSTGQLWGFLRALLAGASVRAAWEQAGIGLSLRTGYRLVSRIQSAESILRTRLSSRAPPPCVNKDGGAPRASGLLQVLTHLQEAFGSVEPICGYQERLQHGFLALN